jgi:hypothetical protein
MITMNILDIEVLNIFYLLVLGHFVADFALQSEVMRKGKNRNRKPDYIPAGQVPTVVWPYWLSSHAGIHAIPVYLITGSFSLSVLEFVIHWVTDFFKCENKLTVHQDQFIHFASKLLIAHLYILVPSFAFVI